MSGTQNTQKTPPAHMGKVVVVNQVITPGMDPRRARNIILLLAVCMALQMTSFSIAGLGEALLSPALSASYLDITPEQHRARVMGITGAVGSLGSLSAPALVIVVIRFVPPQSVFLISAALILSTALLALIVLRMPGRVVGEAADLTWEISRKRTMAAQASLRGVVLSAATARKLKDVA